MHRERTLAPKKHNTLSVHGKVERKKLPIENASDPNATASIPLPMIMKKPSAMNSLTKLSPKHPAIRSIVD